MTLLLTVLGLLLAAPLITHTFGCTWGGGGSLIGGVVNVTGDIEQNISDAIPVNTANRGYPISLPTGKLQSLMVTVDQPATLYVNAASTGSPTDTIVLTPGVPIQWFVGGGTRTPYVGTAGAVTEFFVTTPSTNTAVCNFNVRSLCNT